MNRAADCWATRSLALNGELDPDDLRTLTDSIQRLNRAMLSAQPGEEPWRAVNLHACLIEPPTGSDASLFTQGPMITSPAGVHFYLRSRLNKGALQYLAAISARSSHSWLVPADLR